MIKFKLASGIKYSEIKDHPHLVATLSRNDLEAVLSAIRMDLRNAPYDQQERVPGHGPEPGSSSSAFVDQPGLWRPNPDLKDQRTIDILAAHRDEVQQRKAKENPFLKNETSALDLFGLSHLLNSDQNADEQKLKQSIRDVQLGTADEKQLLEYQKWLDIKEVQGKDPLGLTAKYLDSQLQVPEDKLTEEQRQNFDQQRERQKTMQLTDKVYASTC